PQRAVRPEHEGARQRVRDVADPAGLVPDAPARLLVDAVLPGQRPGDRVHGDVERVGDVAQRRPAWAHVFSSGSLPRRGRGSVYLFLAGEIDAQAYGRAGDLAPDP